MTRQMTRQIRHIKFGQIFDRSMLNNPIYETATIFWSDCAESLEHFEAVSQDINEHRRKKIEKVMTRYIRTLFATGNVNFKPSILSIKWRNSTKLQKSIRHHGFHGEEYYPFIELLKYKCLHRVWGEENKKHNVRRLPDNIANSEGDVKMRQAIITRHKDYAVAL